jgi:hypothetical protein
LNYFLVLIEIVTMTTDLSGVIERCQYITEPIELKYIDTRLGQVVLEPHVSYRKGVLNKVKHVNKVIACLQVGNDFHIGVELPDGTIEECLARYFSHDKSFVIRSHCPVVIIKHILQDPQLIPFFANDGHPSQDPCHISDYWSAPRITYRSPSGVYQNVIREDLLSENQREQLMGQRRPVRPVRVMPNSDNDDDNGVPTHRPYAEYLNGGGYAEQRRQPPVIGDPPNYVYEPDSDDDLGAPNDWAPNMEHKGVMLRHFDQQWDSIDTHGRRDAYDSDDAEIHMGNSDNGEPVIVDDNEYDVDEPEPHDPDDPDDPEQVQVQEAFNELKLTHNTNEIETNEIETNRRIRAPRTANMNAERMRFDAMQSYMRDERIRQLMARHRSERKSKWQELLDSIEPFEIDYKIPKLESRENNLQFVPLLVDFNDIKKNGEVMNVEFRRGGPLRHISITPQYDDTPPIKYDVPVAQMLAIVPVSGTYKMITGSKEVHFENTGDIPELKLQSDLAIECDNSITMSDVKNKVSDDILHLIEEYSAGLPA